MDGVVADFTGGLADAIGPSEHFSRERTTGWKLTTGHEATDSAVHAAMREPGFFRGLEPIPGAVPGVRWLLERTEARFCTTPLLDNPTCEQDKFDWIEEHYGRAAADRMILTQDKTLSVGRLLVDDKPTITGSAAPSWQQVFFDQPYNRGIEGHRITGWTPKDVDTIMTLLGR